MLKLDDIIALAKQGYKPADIKELIELSKSADEAPDSSEGAADTGSTSTPAEDDKKSEEASKGTITDASPEDDKVIDYKKKAEELEKKIQDLQKANIHKNIADNDDNKSDSDVFADAMKSFM